MSSEIFKNFYSRKPPENNDFSNIVKKSIKIACLIWHASLFYPLLPVTKPLFQQQYLYALFIFQHFKMQFKHWQIQNCLLFFSFLPFVFHKAQTV